jgi:TPR repeat protein
MVTGGKVSGNELRALADAGDGLAAFRYGKLLQSSVPPAKAGSAAHYYAIAAYTGRAFAVAPLGQLLVSEGADYGPSLLEQSLNALTVQAISGNAKAAQLLAEMYGTGVPFGHDPKQAQHFTAIAGQDDPAGALKLGISLINDPADADLDHVGARAALTIAADSTNLAAKVTAQNLLRLLDTPATLSVKVTP